MDSSRIFGLLSRKKAASEFIGIVIFVACIRGNEK